MRMNKVNIIKIEKIKKILENRNMNNFCLNTLDTLQNLRSFQIVQYTLKDILKPGKIKLYEDNRGEIFGFFTVTLGKFLFF